MKYSELPDTDRTKRIIPQTDGSNVIVYGSPLFLYCDSCDARYSATRGDYWNVNPDTPTSPPPGGFWSYLGGCYDPSHMLANA